MLIFFVLSTFDAISQKPQGAFLKDSVIIGEEFDYALSYRHAPEKEIFFPDTTQRFGSFELVRRNFFSTKTESNVSIDSVVYTLRTFDIAQVQKLTLPVYIYADRDCTAIYSNYDSVYLKDLISADSLQKEFQSDTKLKSLPPDIDYLQLIRVLFSILIAAGLIYFLFGDLILKRYKLFMFGQRHKEFLSTFNKLVSIKAQKGKISEETLGKALVLWKKHLEWLENKPFTSFTTKEIIETIPDEALENALRSIDSAIYGGQAVNIENAVEVLKNTSIDFFNQRKETLFTENV